MTITVTVGGSYLSTNPFKLSPVVPDDWTTPVPSADSRIIYVSSSIGNDAWNGLFPDNSTGGLNGPKASLFAACRLLRNGFPDWILLLRGDVWTNVSFGHWTTTGFSNGVALSGRSPTEPMVIWSYGSSAVQPEVRYGSNQGWFHRQNSPAPVNYLTVLGIHMTAHTHQGLNSFSAGFACEGLGSFIKIEDCHFEKGAFGVWFTEDRQRNNVVVRKNRVLDCQSYGDGCGIWIGKTDQVLVERNFVDATGININESLDFHHGIFLSETCTNTRTPHNTVTRPGAVGIFSACGYPVTDNVVIEAPWGIINGSVGFQHVPAGCPIQCDGNLVVEGKDYADNTPAGDGIVVYNCAAGSVANNIVTRNAGTLSTRSALLVQEDGATPVNSLTIEGNRSYKWGRGYRFIGPGNLFSIRIRDNDIQEPLISGGIPNKLIYLQNSQYPSQMVEVANNRFDRSGVTTDWFQIGATEMDLAAFKTAVGDTTSTATAVTYPGAANTIGSYHGSIGGTATTQGFIDSRRARHRYGSGATLWATNLEADAVLAAFRGYIP